MFLQITHAMSSILAALTAAIMGTPADVIKTRVMNQPIDNNGLGMSHPVKHANYVTDNVYIYILYMA